MKVLILYNHLFHYRIPIWNILSRKYELTVAYTHPANQQDISKCEFKTIFIPANKISKIVFHKDNILKLANQYDVVLSYGQVTYIKFSTLGFLRRRFKLIYWYIGAPASYNRHYGDGNRLYFKIYDFFHKRADALVFYSQPPVDFHVKRGFPKEKLFVANNTVSVDRIVPNYTERDTILFIGTLYLEKGLKILLDSYKIAYFRCQNIPKLTIVGGGEQFNIIQNWISDNGLESRIIMTGPIYDSLEKAKIFNKSIVCISPLQAGLSVLESMGYGVPFITSEDAITGGEAFNIINHITGMRIQDINTLPDIICDIASQKEKYVEMGRNAYLHYWNNRKPEDMAQGLSDAIEYVMK